MSLESAARPGVFFIVPSEVSPVTFRPKHAAGGPPARESTRRGAHGAFRTLRGRRAPLLALLAACGIAAALPGCSLFVMAGKMFFGDPKVSSVFKQSTRTDLAKEGKRILIVCSSPDAVKSEFPSLDVELLDGVTRRLKVRGVEVVDPDDVATWLDDHGGRWGDLTDLAEKFHADYVVHVDVARFTCREDNSPALLRGQAEGRVHAYRISDGPSGKQSSEVMDHEFVSVYPAGYPVSIEKKSARLFTQEYVDRVCTKLAQMFYDHPLSEEIE